MGESVQAKEALTEEYMMEMFQEFEALYEANTTPEEREEIEQMAKPIVEVISELTEEDIEDIEDMVAELFYEFLNPTYDFFNVDAEIPSETKVEELQEESQ